MRTLTHSRAEPIFLSALFTGRIYFRSAEREGSGAMWRKLWIRTGKLYCYQLLLLAFAFVIEAPIAARGNTPAVHNLLDFYFAAGRTRAFIDAALMIYRPPCWIFPQRSPKTGQ